MARARAKKKGGRSAKAEASGVLARLRTLLGGFLMGEEVEDATAERLQEIKGLACIGMSIWLLIALATFYGPYDDVLAEGKNWAGQIGYYVADKVLLALGWSSYMLCLLALAWGCVLVGRKNISFPAMRLFGGLTFLLTSSFLLQLAFGESWARQYLMRGQELGMNENPYGPGGYLALELIGPQLASSTPGALGPPGELVTKFGEPGLWLLLTLATLLAFMLAIWHAGLFHDVNE